MTLSTKVTYEMFAENDHFSHNKAYCEKNGLKFSKDNTKVFFHN